MSQSGQLTLRGLDRRLQREIRELARRERISLNKAALRLLEKGAGLAAAPPADTIGHTLDHLFGTWSEQEAQELLDAVRPLEAVDDELWR